MAIEVQGLENVLARLEQLPEKVQANSVQALAAAGQQFVEKALSTKTYQDRTGRLTASIGWGVAQDGSIVKTGGFGGGEGAEQGIATLESAAAQTAGTALIVVAGMHYATYVERKGFSVLDGARLDTASIVETIKHQLLQ